MLNKARAHTFLPKWLTMSSAMPSIPPLQARAVVPGAKDLSTRRKLTAIRLERLRNLLSASRRHAFEPIRECVACELKIRVSGCYDSVRSGTYESELRHFFVYPQFLVGAGQCDLAHLAVSHIVFSPRRPLALLESAGWLRILRGPPRGLTWHDVVVRTRAAPPLVWCYHNFHDLYTGMHTLQHFII